MILKDFIALYGFDPLDLPNVKVDYLNGDERDAIIIATRQNKFVSVNNKDKVLAGWKYVGIKHRCFTPTAVTL